MSPRVRRGQGRMDEHRFEPSAFSLDPGDPEAIGTVVRRMSPQAGRLGRAGVPGAYPRASGARQPASAAAEIAAPAAVVAHRLTGGRCIGGEAPD